MNELQRPRHTQECCIKPHSVFASHLQCMNTGMPTHTCSLNMHVGCEKNQVSHIHSQDYMYYSHSHVWHSVQTLRKCAHGELMNLDLSGPLSSRNMCISIFFLYADSNHLFLSSYSVPCLYSFHNKGSSVLLFDKILDSSQNSVFRKSAVMGRFCMKLCRS